MVPMIVKWIAITALFMASPKLFKGVKVKSLPSAAGAAALLGVLNAVVTPILKWVIGILILPINFLTLGLAGLVVALGLNVAALAVTDKLVDGLEIENSALIPLSLSISMLGFLIGLVT